jgi:hypothetical protein
MEKPPMLEPRDLANDESAGNFQGWRDISVKKTCTQVRVIIHRVMPGDVENKGVCTV